MNKIIDEPKAKITNLIKTDPKKVLIATIFFLLAISSLFLTRAFSDAKTDTNISHDAPSFHSRLPGGTTEPTI